MANNTLNNPNIHSMSMINKTIDGVNKTIDIASIHKTSSGIFHKIHNGTLHKSIEEGPIHRITTHKMSDEGSFKIKHDDRLVNKRIEGGIPKMDA